MLVAIVLWTSVDFLLSLDTPKLNVPTEIKPTSTSRCVRHRHARLTVIIPLLTQHASELWEATTQWDEERVVSNSTLCIKYTMGQKPDHFEDLN